MPEEMRQPTATAAMLRDYAWRSIFFSLGAWIVTITGAYASYVVIFTSHPWAPPLQAIGPSIAVLLITIAHTALLVYLSLRYCVEVLSRDNAAVRSKGIKATAVVGAFLSIGLSMVYSLAVLLVSGVAIGVWD